MPYSSHAQVGKAEPMPDDGSVTSEELASTWRAENESRRLDLQERQHVEQTAGSSGSSSGNSLTRKAGPLPVWGWIIIGSIAAYLAYKWYKANNSTSGTTTSVSNLLPAGTSDASGSTSGTGTTTNPLPIPNPLAGLVQQGGGWWLPNSEMPIQDSQSGNWFTWLSPGAAQVNPTIQRYVQIAPGNFQKVIPGVVLPPGTPQYFLGGPPVAGDPYTVPTPGSSTTASVAPTSSIIPTGTGVVAGGTNPANPPVSANNGGNLGFFQPGQVQKGIGPLAPPGVYTA